MVKIQYLSEVETIGISNQQSKRSQFSSCFQKKIGTAQMR